MECGIDRVESIEADAEMLALVVDCLTTIGLREFQCGVMLTISEPD